MVNVTNSARQIAMIAEELEQRQRVIDDLDRQANKRNAILVAGAEANIEQKHLLEEELELTKKQNTLLLENYKKLSEMYDAQLEANAESSRELKKSKQFNAIMMLISIISMVAAVVSAVVSVG